MATHLQTWGTYWLHGGSGGPASGFDIHGSIQVYLDSQSQANNTSSIFIDHYVYAKVTGTNLGTTATVTSKYRANNGSFGGTYKSVSKSITIYPDDGEKSFYIGRTWHTITHNADGTARLYVQGSISCDGSSTTSSFNKSITTIQRMSTITATRANIGEVSQLTISRKNTGYTHSIQYAFGSLSGYILADGSTTTSETKISAESIGFTVPTTFYAQIPSAKEGLCTLTIKTYNGSTQIGSAQTGTFYADVADNANNRPGLSTSVVDINDKTKALTDIDTKLIKGYSTARVAYSASGKNSASIKTVTINGETVTSSPKDYTHFDANTISVIATDSRGFSTTATPAYTMLEYFDPSISMSAKRTAPTESEIKMSFSGNFYNKSFGTVANALTLSWVYRIKGDTSWTTGGDLTLNTHYKISGDTFYSGTGSSASEISLGKIFSYENTYEIGITYGDKLYGPVTTVTTVSKGKPVIGWKDKEVNVNGEIKRYDVSILEIMYPVGSIYTSVLDKNPKDLFNFGTWERLQNVFLLGAGTHSAGETGGSEKVSLTVSQLPSHGHPQNYSPGGADTNRMVTTTPDKGGCTGDNIFGTGQGSKAAAQAGWVNSGATFVGTGKVGSNEAHENMPPYLSVYMWKRTA